MASARMSSVGILLHVLDMAAGEKAYARVLRSFGDGIKQAEARMLEAADEGPEDYAEDVLFDEIDVVENLLGTAYVLCQTRINAVVQVARRVREEATADGTPFAAFSDARGARALGEQFDGTYSKIEVLWALGNYFKHRDEWDLSTWTNPPPQRRQTVEVLLAAGLTPNSTGNLRTGAEALGNPDYHQTTVFEEIIRTWSDEVRTRTRAAFGR